VLLHTGDRRHPLVQFRSTLAVLKHKGENVGTLLIGEGLARRFVCGEFRCPRLKGWC
jgi:hypothetical protein